MFVEAYKMMSTINIVDKSCIRSVLTHIRTNETNNIRCFEFFSFLLLLLFARDLRLLLHILGNKTVHTIDMSWFK
jgi:hypothetical protein